MAAYRYGCKRVNVAFAGLGERTGNAALEQILANYVREYSNPGLRLEVLTEIASLIHKNVVPIPEKHPVVGSNIFITQAGLHQTGIQRQGQAQGGLLYLPFDPAVVGRQELELNRIGALSGMDGIISILDRQREAGSIYGERLTVASKLVKLIYDRIHEAYDGHYDHSLGRYVDYRTTFFEAEELTRMAEQL